MRSWLLVSSMLVAVPAWAVDLNLTAPVTNTGGPAQFLLGFPWGSSAYGGAQNTLVANLEEEWYTAKNVSTSHGDLILTATPAASTGGNPNGLPFNSGAVSTAAMNSSMPRPGGFQFDGKIGGTVSVTASVPTGPGLWPAIWFEPVSGKGACEVDLMEAPFNNPNRFQSSLHGGTGLGQVVNTSTPLSAQNTYAVTFGANTITYQFNGQQIAQVAKPADCNQPMYLLLNLAVGGSWPNSYAKPAANTNAQMVISRVSFDGPDGAASGGLIGAATPPVASMPMNDPATPVTAPVSAPQPSAGGSDPVIASPAGAAPLPQINIDPNATPTHCTVSGGGDGAFHVANGQIIGPDGKVFIARGFNIYDDLIGGALDQILAVYHGVNFIRVGIHSYQPPSSYSFVNAFTSKGIVLEFEDHPDAGGDQDAGPPGGLSAELAWYSAMAQAFKGNPFVWFGTFNEPKPTSGLSQWDQQIYNAVRSTGNNTIIMVEPSGSRPNNLQQALNAGTFAGMTNIVWDPHVYGYQNGFSSDPSSVQANIDGMVAAAQRIQSRDGLVPVIIGEYGISTDGTSEDPNGVATVTGVIQTGARDLNPIGSAAWAWNPGGTSDHLTNGGASVTDPYGTMLQIFINVDRAPLTQCQQDQQVKAVLDNANLVISSAAQPSVAQESGNEGSLPPPPDPSTATASAQNDIASVQQQTTNSVTLPGQATMDAVDQQLATQLKALGR
jgi:hypothetical protein